MDCVAMFGETLRQPDGKTVKTAEAIGTKAVLAIYFSAHWCPPCRGFTPTLCEKYIDLQDEDKDFEMVFVSSDRDEEAFNEYHGEMTFLALPFSERKLKAKLSKKYKVSGIPSLVFVDVKTGKLITDDGRTEISSPKYIENFPYRPTPFDLMAALGPQLRKPNGDMVDTATAKGKVLALYFSAHWCPPCRGFTPTLCEKYTALKSSGKDFEMVFVSSDRDEGAFNEYAGEMTFLALPFAQREAKEALSKHFKVSGIPSLVFVDAEGELITDQGRAAVSAESFIEDFPYHPKPVNEIGADVNDHVSLIVLLDKSDAGARKAATTELTTVAEREFAKPEDARTIERYFTGTDGPVARVRGACGYDDAGDEPVMLIADLADEGAYYHPEEGKTAVTAANIDAFAAAFEAGTLERKQFGQ